MRFWSLFGPCIVACVGVPFRAIPPAPFIKTAIKPSPSFESLESLSLQDQVHDRGELDSFLEEDGADARTESSTSLSLFSIHQDAEDENDEDDAPAAGLVLADEDYLDEG